MAAKSAAPQNLGCISFGGISCLQASAVGGSTPKPGPFLLCEKKGGKKAHQGLPPWTPCAAQPRICLQLSRKGGNRCLYSGTIIIWPHTAHAHMATL